ncbi:MAG: protein kinase [Anaerolineae bacterium]|nr:protein kinase [Anaerolineae bacterium]
MHQALSAQEALRRRFLDEARAASTLEHPNIARVLAYETADAYTFLVMELVTGGSLRAYIRRLRGANRSLEFLEISSMVREMADALHYAHQQGLLHRDIKPENIVLREDTAEDGRKVYHPILTDFGLAQVSEGSDVFSTDQPAVTYPYMSPEECLGQRTDARSDIYELGTLMYEIVTGQVPFQPRSLAEAIRMHTREPVPRPANLRTDIPTEMERIILKCLEKEPNNRFLTAAELSRAMQNLSARLAEEIPEEAATPEQVEKTVLMPSPIPEAMPQYTPQPISDDQVGFERLVLTSEKYATFAVALNKNVLTIGRASDQTVRLDVPAVSRRHARIERGFNNTYRIVDMGSANGTYLGNKRLTPNVAEVWTPDKTVRIGDYWLRIEPVVTRKNEVRRPAGPGLAPAVVAGAAFSPAAVAAAPMTNLDDGGVALAGDEAGAGMLAAPRPARVVLPPPEHDKVAFKVINPIVTVAPGSSTTIQMEVQNLSALVDHFVISLVGLPPGWSTVQQAPLYLLPNHRDTATITLHPPLASSTTEGAHYFEVRATARAQQIRSVAVQCAMNVLPFKNFTSNLEPRRVTARGRPEVQITNTGNTHATFTLELRDREQALNAELSGKQYTLGPGQNEYVGLRVKPRSRPFLGVERSIPYEVIVNAGDERVPAQTLQGEVSVRPRFPIWILSFLAIALVMCLLLSLFAVSQVQGIIAGNNTATAVAIATRVVVDATATAVADPDNDGLSTFQEQALGLKPDDPDTDKDGLIDGDEVRIWNTNPLNPDTDGDGVKDGVEVNELGTNPLVADSDGDGFADNDDTVPNTKATPTPTPFPTLPGTEGDICAGSPPTRLQPAIDARVEAGGVNNRLRDNPGVATGQVIGLMPPTSGFRILEGPVCDPEEQLRWWKVDYNGVVGWTAEGRGDEYYLCPPDACGDGSGAGGGGGAGGAGGGGGGTGGGGGGAPGDGTTGSIPPTNPDVVNLVNAAVQSVPQPVTAAGLDRGRMGLQLYKSLDTASWQVALDRTGSLGVGWIKVQLNWAAIQPDGPGTLGSLYSVFEANLQAARARGFRTLVSVAKAPAWARTLQTADAGPPDDPQALADFLTLLLGRSGPLIDAIEIWNEPNLRLEWTGNLAFSGAGYMQLFQPAYTAIRTYSPLLVIVTAGLAPAGDTSGSVDDRAFLQQMYLAGLANFKDVVVGVHPYSWGNPPGVRCCNAVEGEGWDDDPHFFFLSTLEDYRSIMLANGHDVPLWATEFGWATWAGFPGDPPEPWIGYNTLADQATFTLQAFQIGQRLPFMGPMFLWNLNFATTAAIEARDGKAAYSLLINDSDIRPAYGSLVPAPSG